MPIVWLSYKQSNYTVTPFWKAKKKKGAAGSNCTHSQICVYKSWIVCEKLQQKSVLECIHEDIQLNWLQKLFSSVSSWDR